LKTITISTGKPYDAHIGKGILQRIGNRVAAISGQRYSRVLVVTDDKVGPLYGKTVADSLQQAGFAVSTFAFKNGEASKTMDTAMDIIAGMSKNGLTRSDLLVALGGGVTGDLTGFAASIYQRGIDYIQIPTTLLAAVDSSVGGKTSVNTAAGKNMVGSFWQPRLVICDTATLDTLPEEILTDGLAEVIKYGCILDDELFAILETEVLQEHLPKTIARCIQLKAIVVSEDERDTGLRQILNFGHTAAHGIEKLSNYAISHGQAVSIGMCIAAAAGEAAGKTEPGATSRIRALLTRYGLPIKSGFTIPRLAKASLGDKKRSGDDITLVTLRRVGQALLHPVPAETLQAFWTAGKAIK